MTPGAIDYRDRLREYARAYFSFTLVSDRDMDDPVRSEVRGRLYDLEEALMLELAANAGHAEVERRVLELYDRIDQLRQDAEELTSALARVE